MDAFRQLVSKIRNTFNKEDELDKEINKGLEDCLNTADRILKEHQITKTHNIVDIDDYRKAQSK